MKRISIVSLVAVLLGIPLAGIANVIVIYLNQPPEFELHPVLDGLDDEEAWVKKFLKQKRQYWDPAMVLFAMERIKRDFPTSFSVLAGNDASYDLQARRLIQSLENNSEKELLNPKGLELISPARDTIIYLIVLDNIIDSVVDHPKSAPRHLPSELLPEGRFWDGIARALTEFDPVQVRYVGQRLRRLVQIVANGAEQTQNSIPAIQLLQNVILRLDSTSSTLTTTHFLYVKTCLLSRAYSEATYILDMPLYSVVGDASKMALARTLKFLCADHESASAYLNPATGLTGKFTSAMLLSYNIYAAMCYMALGQHHKAKFFLEAVIVAPTAMNVLSKIMVEAYKKWLLLGILMSGETPTPPKALSGNNLRSMRALAKPYECVADAFKSGDFQQLQSEVEAGAAWWAEDVNEGLIHQVCEAFRKFKVVRLGDTFSSVSVSEVANKTSPDPSNISETIAYTSGLIQSGQLKAELFTTSGTTGNTVPILRFTPSISAIRQAARRRDAAKMAKKAEEMQSLWKHVADDDQKLEVTKEYVDFMKKLRKSKDSEQDPALGDPPGMEIDEEIMGDL